MKEKKKEIKMWYYIITFIISWFGILLYIEFNKDDWYYMDMKDADSFLIVHLLGILGALVMPFCWPLLFVGYALTKLSKYIKVKITEIKKRKNDIDDIRPGD